MEKIITLLLLLLLINIVGCSSEKAMLKVIEFEEDYQTARNEIDNVDSPTFWQGKKNENWLISTAKTTNQLIVDNAVDGKNIQRFGSKGNGLGNFLRPNGIFAIDDYLFVVERDNHRVQLLNLPSMKPLGTFGDSLLIKPYGIYVTGSNDNYYVFVTDNYEYEKDNIPPDSLLGKRVLKFTISIQANVIHQKFEKYIGNTKGIGVLRIVESLHGDPQNNLLLIAEEDKTNSSVKVYDMEGNFTGKIIGKGIFKGQVEGISLYDDEHGFWIITDQSFDENVFHVFDRVTFEHLAAFKGKNTTNTDGIWLTQKSFGKFNKGVFFAVNNDGNVSAFNFENIIKLVKSKNK